MNTLRPFHQSLRYVLQNLVLFRLHHTRLGVNQRGPFITIIYCMVKEILVASYPDDTGDITIGEDRKCLGASLVIFLEAL